jgi:hypothetical protein
MPERHPRADHQQPIGLRGGRRVRPDAEPPGRQPHQHRVTRRLRRRDQQQLPGRRRQGLAPLEEGLFDPARQPWRAQDTEPARQVFRRQPARQLQQRQRVAPRLRDNPVNHPLIQPNAKDFAQQRPRVGISETLDNQLGQPRELPGQLPGREEQRDRLGQQPPRRER